jgi:hypothetical protein
MRPELAPTGDHQARASRPQRRLEIYLFIERPRDAASIFCHQQKPGRGAAYPTDNEIVANDRR